MSARPSPRLFLLLTLCALAACATIWALCGLPTLNIAWLHTRQAELLALQVSRPWAFTTGLFLLFTVLSALALPGCSVLALAAGLCLGWLPGTILVVVASTVGATISFLAARHWLRDAVRRRFGHRWGHRWSDSLVAIENGLARDGAYYLFSLRVAPIIPYALINPLMGLSSMPLRQFFSVSLLGMLAGSAAYVYAGTVLSEASSWGGLFSPGLVFALLTLALLPWVLRWLVGALRPAQSVTVR